MSTHKPIPDAQEFIRHLEEAGATVQKGTGRMLDENSQEVDIGSLFRTSTTFEEYLEQQLQDPEFAAAWAEANQSE